MGRKKFTPRKCGVCGKTIEQRPDDTLSRYNELRFCRSTGNVRSKCYTIGTAAARLKNHPLNNCVICGEPIARKPQDGITRYNEIKTCRATDGKKSPCYLKHQMQSTISEEDMKRCEVCGKIIPRKSGEGRRDYLELKYCRGEGGKGSRSQCYRTAQGNKQRIEVDQRFCIVCGDPIVRGSNESPSVYERSLYCRNEDKSKSKCYREAISSAKSGAKMPPRRPYAERGYIDLEPPITVWADHHPEMPEEDALKLDLEQISVNRRIDRKINEKCSITSGLIRERFMRGALR